jgi:hypothetical protein
VKFLLLFVVASSKFKVLCDILIAVDVSTVADGSSLRSTTSTVDVPVGGDTSVSGLSIFWYVSAINV